MLYQTFILLAGLAVLTVGADIFVRGSSNLARTLGISPLIIGLTVVAFGTSAPELCVSVMAAIQGSADMAVGNVLGSNVFNILMIVGISALISPIKINKSITAKEMPIMILVMAAFLFAAQDLIVSRLEGILLVVGIVAYVIYNYISARLTPHIFDDGEELTSTPKSVFFLVLGIAGLVLGSQWIVTAATVLAKAFGVPDAIIGITLLAVGTSLPELATTVAAAVKGHPDLAIGNAIGSNVFNVLCVLGTTSIVRPLDIAVSIKEFDLLYMVFVCFITFLLMKSRHLLSRVEGGVLVILYLLYMSYLAYLTYV